MTDDNTELASISERPFVIGAPPHAARNRSTLERVWLACIDQRESLYASLHILRTVGGMAGEGRSRVAGSWVGRAPFLERGIRES